jgi:mRNA-degrading endonuclease toxin of MazEF toxin-antitoxin module
MALTPGDVVLSNFLGAQGRKWRPGVVVSTHVCHANCLDVIVAELTSQVAKAHSPTDYALQDWKAAGLHQPSAFGVYFSMDLQSRVTRIGRLSDRDWQEAQARLRLGPAVT